MFCRYQFPRTHIYIYREGTICSHNTPKVISSDSRSRDGEVPTGHSSLLNFLGSSIITRTKETQSIPHRRCKIGDSTTRPHSYNILPIVAGSKDFRKIDRSLQKDVQLSKPKYCQHRSLSATKTTRGTRFMP